MGRPVAVFDVGAYLPRVLLARTPDSPRHWHTDGTMIFADISGFTKLSDQLARRGREGAEDLISTLVRVFTLLLSASDDGGDLIKFGGDAMAVVYDGPDHERRACHAAYMMQRIMGVIGNVELTGAKTKLSMSVGIHSGRLDFLVPGVEQQDLIVAGATVTRTLELEIVADAGEIVVSETTAAALPDSWLGARKGPGYLLRRAGAVPSTGSQILFRNYDEEQIWRHLPTVFRERPDLLAAGSDHRRAAMAFIHVTNLDDEIGRDPEGVLARMDQLARVVEEVAETTGISVLDTDVGKGGYRYFLAAGAPAALEDPEGRMLRALLKIVQADVGLDIQGGCSAGRVFAGTVGAPFRCTYAAMGDPTNLAARLCGKAAPGEVVAHAELMDRSLTQFDHSEIQIVELKGKPEPVPVVRVHEVLGQRGRALANVPFVGRERELATIAEAYGGLAAGQGAVVEIIGEAGLGKSRLADTALANLALPVLTISADPYGASVPYQSVRALVYALLGLFPDSGPEEVGERLTAHVEEATPHLVPWLPLLGPALSATVSGDTQLIDDLDERFRVTKLHETLRDLVRSLIVQPQALLIDDAQWVDESSAEALSFAFVDLRQHPWAILLTRRDGDEGLHGSDQLPTVAVRLEPFTAEEAESLLAGAATSLRPDEVGAILGRGGGNPYFLLQLADTGTSDDLPDTVEELVGTRIDGLPATERELLRDAAVLGKRFPAALYEKATGDLEFRDAISSPGLATFLQMGQDGTVAFQRDIYREVAYGQLAYRKRRQLHLHVARAIEDEPRLAGSAKLPMLSLHYYAGGVWERAYRTSLEAGDAAKAAWANDEAVVFFRRAHDAGKKISAPAHHLRSLGESIGDVLQVSGRFEDAAQAYRGSLRTSPEPDERIRLMLKVGRMLDHEGEFVAAGRLYKRARLLAAEPEVEDPVLKAEIDVADASSRHLRGRNKEGRDLALRAWQETEGVPDSERVKRIRARAAFMHDTCAGFVDGPKGTKFGDMPLHLFEEIGDHYYAGIVANNLGISAFESGRWTEAIEIYRRGRDYCARAGDIVGEAIMDMNIGEILGYQGHLDDALPLMEAALHVFTVHDVTYWYADGCAFLAAVELERGNLARARELLGEAGRLHGELGASHAADHVAVKELDLLLREGYLDGVLAGGQALLDRRQALMPVHESRTRRALGIAQLRLGDPETAVDYLRDALAIAERMESQYDVAQTEMALVEAQVSDAEERRRRAERTFADLGILTRVDQPA